MSVKGYKRAMLICMIIGLIFVAANFIHTEMQRDLPFYARSRTNLLELSFIMSVIIIYLRISMEIKQYQERIEKLEDEVEQLKRDHIIHRDKCKEWECENYDKDDSDDGASRD